jgi:hypothetical protein
LGSRGHAFAVQSGGIREINIKYDCKAWGNTELYEERGVDTGVLE